MVCFKRDESIGCKQVCFFSLLLFGGEDAQIEFDCFAFQRESESITVCPLHSVLSRRERNPGRGDLLPVV